MLETHVSRPFESLFRSSFLVTIESGAKKKLRQVMKKDIELFRLFLTKIIQKPHHLDNPRFLVVNKVHLKLYYTYCNLVKFEISHQYEQCLISFAVLVTVFNAYVNKHIAHMRNSESYHRDEHFGSYCIRFISILLNKIIWFISLDVCRKRLIQFLNIHRNVTVVCCRTIQMLLPYNRTSY